MNLLKHKKDICRFVPYYCYDCCALFDSRESLRSLKHRCNVLEVATRSCSGSCSRKADDKMRMDLDHFDVDDDDDENCDSIIVKKQGNIFFCEYCCKRFATNRRRKVHVREVHLKPFICTAKADCGKRFGTREMLQTHERTHFAIKPFACRICSMKFTDKRNLRHHQKRFGH